MAKDKKPIKQYYDIKVEAMVPATLSYRIYAEDENEALELVKRASPNQIKYKIAAKKDKKLLVYKPGTSLIIVSLNK
jgi:hypothetical protein